MKKIKRLLMLLSAAAVILTCLSSGVYLRAEEDTKEIDIMFFHDTHSHLNSFYTIENGEGVELGGFARIKTLINEQKEKNPDTMILDGGDFSMGTLVQTIFEQEAAELRMLGAIGTDVTTVGNHEFDYRSKGLANMLKSAAHSGDPLPEFVLCNVD